MDITARQIAIIKATVEEFTETAKPVGSVTLESKYKLGVSPATLRNEMAELEKKGFLSQPHSSAGRTPTPMAIKFYINQLMKEQDLSVAEEVSVKEKVWDHRFDSDSLLREACQVLANRANSLSVATTSGGKSYHAGSANLLSFSEFFNIDVTRKVLELLDKTELLSDIFSRAVGNQPIHVLVGDELGLEFFKPVSLIFADLQIGDKKGNLGVISSYRQHYQKNIPLVRYVANLVNQISQDW